MRIAFVASNPSHLGPESPAKRNLYSWIKKLNLKVGYSFFNVSSFVTPDNRPLKKSEYELVKLRNDLRGIRKVVALGATAADALSQLDIDCFKLPHPSPKNRALNDKRAIDTVLEACRLYLEDEC